MVLSLEEQATNYQTMRHVERVRNLINRVVMLFLCSRHPKRDLPVDLIDLVEAYWDWRKTGFVPCLSKQLLMIFDNTTHHPRQDCCVGFVECLLARGETHDQSKMEEPEVKIFTEWTPKLAALTYGSDEYNRLLKETLAFALAHHYGHNRHHPEHFVNGVNDMNLVDIFEMFIDWKAASERHDNGNIRTSVDINAERFKLSEQTVNLLQGTADLLDGV